MQRALIGAVLAGVVLGGATTGSPAQPRGGRQVTPPPRVHMTFVAVGDDYLLAHDRAGGGTNHVVVRMGERVEKVFLTGARILVCRDERGNPFPAVRIPGDSEGNSEPWILVLTLRASQFHMGAEFSLQGDGPEQWYRLVNVTRAGAGEFIEWDPR